MPEEKGGRPAVVDGGSGGGGGGARAGVKNKDPANPPHESAVYLATGFD
jgi:hypothetical protein